jgi:hypothetical protein
VIIIYPFLEVVRKDYSPELFLHTLEAWPYNSDGFNGTLVGFAEFEGGEKVAGHQVAFIGACAPPPGADARLPLSALPEDACGGAWAPLLPPAAGGGDRTHGLRRNELFRVRSDTGNSAVWYDIRDSRVLVRCAFARAALAHADVSAC